MTITQSIDTSRPRRFDFITGEVTPTWRGRIHAASAAASTIACGIFGVAASGLALIACLIYSFSMVVCFGVSAGYHLRARSHRAQTLMRRLDHAAINLLIAGTATPLYLLGAPAAWGYPMLVATWSSALIGVIVKLSGNLSPSSSLWFLLTGWTALLALPAIWSYSGSTTALLVLAGGLVYSAGALCFWRKWPTLNPDVFGYHEFWHACTVVGGSLHLLAVLNLVAQIGSSTAPL